MSTHGAFVVPVHDLDAAGRQYSFTVPVGWLRGALDGCEIQPQGRDATLSVLLSKSGTDVIVRGSMQPALVVSCARCLGPVHFEPLVEMSLLLQRVAPALEAAKGGRALEAAKGKKGGAKHAAEVEILTDEVDCDTYEGDEVVLDRFVREAILLESPIFPLCFEGCEGIRPTREANAAATSSGSAAGDPRLRPLLALAKKRPTKE